MKKTFVALIASVGLISSAWAWGDREQGALAGILGTIVWQKINEQASAPAVVQPVPAVIYRETPQTVYRPHRIPRRNTCQVWRETQHPDGTIVREMQCYGLQ